LIFLPKQSPVIRRLLRLSTRAPRRDIKAGLSSTRPGPTPARADSLPRAGRDRIALSRLAPVISYLWGRDVWLAGDYHDCPRFLPLDAQTDITTIRLAQLAGSTTA